MTKKERYKKECRKREEREHKEKVSIKEYKGIKERVGGISTGQTLLFPCCLNFPFSLLYPSLYLLSPVTSLAVHRSSSAQHFLSFPLQLVLNQFPFAKIHLKFNKPSAHVCFSSLPSPPSPPFYVKLSCAATQNMNNLQHTPPSIPLFSTLTNRVTALEKYCIQSFPLCAHGKCI